MSYWADYYTRAEGVLQLPELHARYATAQPAHSYYILPSLQLLHQHTTPYEHV